MGEATKSKLGVSGIAVVVLFALSITCGVLAVACGGGNGDGNTASVNSNGEKDSSPSTPLPPSPLSVAVVERMDAWKASSWRKDFAVIMNLDGEIVPCGCTDGQRGGLLKLATTIEEARQVRPSPELLLLGGNLVPRRLTASRTDAALGYYTSHAGFILESLQRLSPSLTLISKEEALHLADRQSRDKEFPTSVTYSGPNGLPMRLVVGSSHSSSNNVIGMGSDATEIADQWTVKITSGHDAYSGSVDEVDLKPNLVLNLGRPSTIAATSSRLVQQVVNLRAPEQGGRSLAIIELGLPARPPRVDGEIIWLAEDFRATRSLLLRLRTDQVELIEAIERRVSRMIDSDPVLVGIREVKVSMDVGDHPELHTSYASFLTDVTALVPVLDESQDHVGVCATCHAREVEQYLRSDPHAHAWQTLVDAKKDSDPHCISCHSTPVPLLTGPVGAKHPPLKVYKGVLCQSCHLNATEHSKAPARVKPVMVSQSTCIGCHNENQSPGFKFESSLGHVCCMPSNGSAVPKVPADGRNPVRKER